MRLDLACVLLTLRAGFKAERFKIDQSHWSHVTFRQTLFVIFYGLNLSIYLLL